MLLKFKRATKKDIEKLNHGDFTQTCAPRKSSWVVRADKTEDFFKACERAKITPELQERWEKMGIELSKRV
jgi:hypothetical protein